MLIVNFIGYVDNNFRSLQLNVSPRYCMWVCQETTRLSVDGVYLPVSARPTSKGDMVTWTLLLVDAGLPVWGTVCSLASPVWAWRLLECARPITANLALLFNVCSTRSALHIRLFALRLCQPRLWKIYWDSCKISLSAGGKTWAGVTALSDTDHNNSQESHRHVWPDSLSVQPHRDPESREATCGGLEVYIKVEKFHRLRPVAAQPC